MSTKKKDEEKELSEESKQTDLTKFSSVGGLEHIGVPMTKEVALRERDHAVNMAAELLNERAAELRMNRPIDPNSRASSQEERDLVYAESRLMKAAMAIKFDLTTQGGLRCDATADQIWEFERAKEHLLARQEAARKAKAIEGQ